MSKKNISKIDFHIGPRGCGKSEAVELEVSAYPNKIYIGTLIKNLATESTIVKHQERRGDGWILYEISGNFSQDITNLRIMLEVSNNQDAIFLLDGILTWFINSGLKFTLFDLNFFTHEIIQLIKEHKNHWKLINVPAYIFLEDINDFLLMCYKSCTYINSVLCTELNNDINVIDWSYGKYKDIMD